MAKAESIPRRELDESAALRMILEGTATETGNRFFEALVKNLALALDTYGAWVTEYFPEKRTLRAHAFWLGGDWIPHWEMQIDGSPCERVIETAPRALLEHRVVDPVPVLGTDGRHHLER